MRAYPMILIFCFTFGAVSCSVAATTRYVSLDGTNDAVGGYTNWPGAATNLQTVVDASTDGDTILVSNGTYTIASGAQVVNINKSLDVRGEYGRAITIIDGSAARRCVTMGVNSAGNPICLTGFTIRNGATNVGAGVYAQYVRDMYISDCVISNNISTSHGGGLRSDATGTLIVSNCVICNNTNYADGGAMYMAGPIRVLNSTIINNTARSGGAGRFFDETLFQACVISSNVTSVGAGGILGSQSGSKKIVINQCTFSDNSSSGSEGGGISLGSSSNSYISNCVIRGNTATYARAGAGICTRGGGRITGCLIAGNKATTGYGGGIFADGTNALVCQNLTIVSNTAGSAADGGGGIFIGAITNSVMLNSIIFGNSGSAGKSNVVIQAGNFTFTNCCVAPLTSVVGSGNIEVDPLYANVTNNNYHLQAGSPCINQGTNMPWMGGATDFDGRSRIDRFYRQVDMGCYEFLPAGTMVMVH